MVLVVWGRLGCVAARYEVIDAMVIDGGQFKKGGAV